MLEKFLEESMVLVVGKPGEIVAELLDGNKYLNEFLIAKKMDLTINQVRNLLYRLSDHGLVSSIRKKDKKKGWYTYFWKVEVLKTLEFLKGIFAKQIDQLKHKIKSRETKQFYICERCNVEISEENALLKNFTCDECGNVFSSKDNSSVIREFKKESGKLEKQLDLLEKEIGTEVEKIEKKKAREEKKQEKEKKAKRKSSRKAKASKKTSNTKKAKPKAKKTKKGNVKKKVKKPVKKSKPRKGIKLKSKKKK